jgi:hypothetical protein
MLVPLVVSVAIVVLVFNVVVSRHVWADGRRTKQERIAELGLIWCVPAFGGLVALAISAENPDRVRRSRGLFGSAAGAAATSSWTDGSGASQ